MFERYSERARHVIFLALWSAMKRGADVLLAQFGAGRMAAQDLAARSPARARGHSTQVKIKLTDGRKRFANQLCADLNCRLQAAVNRTSVSKERMDSIGRFSMRFVRSKFELHVNSFDDQHIVFQFDFSQRIRHQPLI